MMAKEWYVKGNYFESCNCESVCPCIFLQPPTEGYCKAILGWQIKDGKMGDVDLSGLNIGLYLSAPGSLTDGGWKVALYIDDRASAEQKDALTQIYGGAVGGLPAVFASFTSEVMGVHSAKIDIQYSDKEKQMTIEDIASVKTTAMEGADGGPITVNNPPLAVAPGFSPIVHNTEMASYSHEEEHSHSGTTGLGSAFSYQP